MLPYPLNFWATFYGEEPDFTYADLPEGEANKSFNRELLPGVFDPSSVFHFMPDDSENITDNTLWQITSQQLYLQSDFTLSESPKTDPAKRLRIDNIGGSLYTIRGCEDMKSGYLSCDPAKKRFAVNTDTHNEMHESNEIQDTKWMFYRVQEGDYSNVEHVIRAATIYGNDGYYYCTIHMPLDVKLIEAEAEAYTAAGSPYFNDVTNDWNQICVKMESGYIPANTPAIVRNKNAGGFVTMVPAEGATMPLVAENRMKGSLFSRQLTDAEMAAGDVYVFGMANDRIDFYRNGNANPYNDNRVDGRYVYHNKAYIQTTRSSEIQVSPRKDIVTVFVSTPDEVPEITYGSEGKVDGSDDALYDILGRKINEIVVPGVYLRRGKKILHL